MKPLYIFRHIACEGPGHLAVVLARRDIPWQLVAIDDGDPVPADIDGCSGLVFMGGPMSVNDDLPWIDRELALIRTARAAGMPVLGHCLGGQLISKALGGTITANPVKEIGWHGVRKSGTTTAEKWLAGLPEVMTLFHWHGEAFSIPQGAEVILENDTCAHQAFAIGNTLALQCHVEMQAPMVSEWATLYADEIGKPSATIQSAHEMTADLQCRIAAAQQVADILYERWLEHLQ
ncbi:MAG: type 1 glutamine amidotransferase [Thiohalobacterales bacterium]|nr:type 1 glutamine amidotransferase [Thiohalobacterales bacterium]